MFKRWLSSHRSLAVTLTSTVTILALAITTAVIYGGFPAQKVALNDSAVWVANGEKQFIGRANTSIMELNSVVAGASSDLSVVQSGQTVLLIDGGTSRAGIVDPATSTVLKNVPLPMDDPNVFTAGNNIVVTNGDGEVWITQTIDFEYFDPQTPADLSLGGEAIFAIDSEGFLIAFSRDSSSIYRIDAAKTGTVVESHEVDFGDRVSELSVSWVGTDWAIFDALSRDIVINGHTANLSEFVRLGERPSLQIPSRTGVGILLATSRALLSIPSSGGVPVPLIEGRSGNAAAPLSFDGCTYAAWSDGVAWRSCEGQEPVTMNLSSMSEGAARLGFDRNGDRVVVNDPRSGRTWAVQSRGELIDNWENLQRDEEQERQIVDDNFDAPAEFDKVQKPPVAADDEFGARPGRSTILPVLLNDYDPNGDVLMVSQVEPIDESIGRLDLINDRQQVQITLTDSAKGSVVFQYSVSDGRGGEASATVTVTIRKPEENSPPVQVRRTQTIVAEDGRVTTQVLGDWVDPDGDAFYLASATTTAPDFASFKPDGTVVFTEGGAASEARSVALVVTDGRASAPGNLAIKVSPRGEVPIIADPFVVLAYAGQEVKIWPLLHVTGGTGQIRLISVPSRSGAEIKTNLDAGTFRFSSSQVRTFGLEYVVTDGDQTATGTIRVEVAALPSANTKPITVPKTVFVKSLSSEMIEVASTDIDPAGGVLLVTGVSGLSPASGLRAEVLEQKSIRVTLTAPQENGPVTFSYEVTNGLAETPGVITVIEIPRPAQLQPPIATDDTVSVRVGAAINIPVLANDVHPDGEALTLDPELMTTLGGESGLLFPSGNILRYLAPDRPGNFVANYSVSGPDGQKAQAQVRISVREKVEATNNPPTPVTVVARVLAGESVTIPIPLTGIDADGDSVQLLGQESSPEKGSVTSTGSDSFSYKAGQYSAGTDTFTYTVIDDVGARATGTVRVGISQRVHGARNPVAVADEVSVRPGGPVTVQVLANDSDPDGGSLTVTEVVPVADDGVEVTTDGTVVTVTPPIEPGQYSVIYTIQNEIGGTSQNFVSVTVSDSAPRALPIAKDTVLTLTDVLGRDSIDVNVLANVFFADGPVSGLGVTLLPGYDHGVSVNASKRMTVTVGDKRQIIPFAVSNPDDPAVVAYAFVWVPGYDDTLPQLNRNARALTVASESTLIIPINDYVIAIGGQEVRLLDTTTVQATHSNGSDLVVDDQTLRFRSADKYFGPASISFEVTDGKSADDPQGRTATLVLPIDVTARKNQPPVFNGAVIDFEPGQSKTLDLLRITEYPYPDDLKELAYTAMAPLPVGFEYTLEGQSLTITANLSAVKGTSTAIVLAVRDDLEVGKPGTIRLNVVASSRPLVTTLPDTAVVPREKTTTVDVLANDQATNPFPETPLVVRAIRGIGGDSLPDGVTIVPSSDLSALKVSVTKDAAPQDINVQYQVADATGDPDRFVWGNVKLQVQDVPDPVTGVRVTDFSDKRLTVAWSPGLFNNSPITGYKVLATHAGDGTVFGTTTCNVTNGCAVSTPGNGPANGLLISVVAVNSIGDSKPANISSAVWSDLIPAAPTQLSVVPTNTAAAGGSLALSWLPAPATPGASTVIGYTVLITGPSVKLTLLMPAQSTSFNFNNAALDLKAGVMYSVNIYARNSAQVAGESAWIKSAPVAVTAVGPPSAASGGVNAVVINALGHVRVVWGASDPQGAPSVKYTVGRFDATDTVPSTCQPPVPGSGVPSFTETTWVDTAVADQHTYRYVVYADNGYYCTPTASGEVLTMRPPGKASGQISLQPNGGQYDIRVTGQLSVASLTAPRFEYDVNGNNIWRVVVPDQFLTSAADLSVYGEPMTIRFRGCRDLSSDFCGEPSDGMTRTPLNTRASIVSCVVGENVVPAPPMNAGNLPVTYLYAFNSGGGFSDYGIDNTVPEPVVPLMTETRVRVKAVVDFGAGVPEHTDRFFTDPGFIEAVCAEATP